MFKKILLAVALALPLSGMAQKFGVVDIESIFQAMPESAAMRTEIEQTSKKFEDEYKRLSDEVNKLFADFQTIQNDPNTPESIKERRVNEIQERQAKAEQYRNIAMQDIQRLTEQLSLPIQTKLTDAVKAVGSEGGFTFILPNEQALLLYQGPDVVDVTAQVRAKLGLK